MYLKRWKVDFNPKNGIPTVISRSYCPHLSLHYYNGKATETIGNSLRRYIEYAIQKDIDFSYVKICVEIYLDKGLLEADQLNLGGWKYTH